MASRSSKTSSAHSAARSAWPTTPTASRCRKAIDGAARGARMRVRRDPRHRRGRRHRDRRAHRSRVPMRSPENGATTPCRFRQPPTCRCRVAIAGGSGCIETYLSGPRSPPTMRAGSPAQRLAAAGDRRARRGERSAVRFGDPARATRERLARSLATRDQHPRSRTRSCWAGVSLERRAHSTTTCRGSGQRAFVFSDEVRTRICSPGAWRFRSGAAWRWPAEALPWAQPDSFQSRSRIDA